LEYPLGKVIYETFNWIDQVRFSPDGAHLAFFRHPVGNDDRGDVAIADRSGSLHTVSSGWESEEGLAWAPSGKEVWFSAADQGSNMGIHAVTLDGAQRLVDTQAGSIRIEDISPNGELLLTRDELFSKVELFSQGASARDISWLNYSWYPVLSRDGTLVALIDQSEFGGNDYSIYIRKLDGSSPVRLGRGVVEDISADNKWVLGYDPQGGVVLLPIGAGQPRTLRWKDINVTNAAFLPDSERILVMATPVGSGAHYYLTDINGGALTQLRGESSPSRFICVSPDGHFFAHNANGKWVMESFENSTVTAIPAVGPGEYVVRWAGDGKSVFVVQESDTQLSVYRLVLASGRRELLQTVRPSLQVGLNSLRNGYFGFDVDAAGKSMAISYDTNVDVLYIAQGIN
jgi:eukaryotic-like serine/threonine-protein kinase